MTVLLFFWNLFGFIILATCMGYGVNSTFVMADGWEFVNPLHIYKYAHVNWFGAFVLTLIYNGLCPAAAIIYWFYKLCAVGRK